MVELSRLPLRAGRVAIPDLTLDVELSIILETFYFSHSTQTVHKSDHASQIYAENPSSYGTILKSISPFSTLLPATTETSSTRPVVAALTLTS
jgi:hypothetical protein